MTLILPNELDVADTVIGPTPLLILQFDAPPEINHSSNILSPLTIDALAPPFIVNVTLALAKTFWISPESMS